MLDRLKQRSERHQRPRERVLNEVFRVPGIAGERPAVSVKLRSDWLEDVEEPVPRVLRLLGEIVQGRRIGVSHS